MNQFQQTPSTPKGALRAIRILFGAIIAGAALFSVIVLAFNQTTKTSSPVKEFENVILAAGMAIALLFLIIAKDGYNRSMATAKNSLISLPDKLNRYRSALIVYIALCEGPALFGIILFFVSGYYLMLIITVIMMAAMLAKEPTHQRVVDELGLDWEQRQKLD